MKANELDEGRRKKKKLKGAAYGPGPFGMYGTDAGYSGDGGMAESINPEKFQRLKNFVKFCIKKLGIKVLPKIRLSAVNDTTALGYFVPQDNTIVVVHKNRHQMDIMRTLAHELVHLKQKQTREIDGATGSPDENEANAMAGVLLRVWGQLNPEHFVESRKFTDLEIAVMEGGGSIEQDHTYYLKKYFEEQYKNKVEENFADGKNPGRKGLAKRSGVNCKASVSSLRKTAKNSSGEKQRMAHWCANMKSGRNKE